MEQSEDREKSIGAGLVVGLVAFVLIALVSFYFEKPTHQLSTSVRGDVTSTTR
jgi:hypothetical protein